MAWAGGETGIRERLKTSCPKGLVGSNPTLPTTVLNPLGKPYKRLEAAPGFEPGDRGFADLRLASWLRRLMPAGSINPAEFYYGAGDGT